MPSALLRLVSPTKIFRPMRRTSPPSRVPGRETYSSFRNLASASASDGTSRRRVAVPSGQFTENDGGIFDEHGVGKIGLGRKRNNASAQFAEQFFVSVVLLLGGGQIDGLAVDEGKFAMDDGRADGACDGGKHCGRESLHERV